MQHVNIGAELQEFTGHVGHGAKAEDNLRPRSELKSCIKEAGVFLRRFKSGRYQLGQSASLTAAFFRLDVYAAAVKSGPAERGDVR